MLDFYEITELIAKEELTITPVLNPYEQFQGASFDLRVGSEFTIFRRTNVSHLRIEEDITTIEEDLNRGAEFVSIRKPPDKLILHPGDFALASTLEYIKLPQDIVAEIHGKSAWARLGLVIHGVAGFVDPGFYGTLTLELVNLGKLPIPLYVGVRVAQLTFHRLNNTVSGYLGKYGGCGVKLSKVYEDSEFDRIRLEERKKNMKICPNCGALNTLNAKFCNQCVNQFSLKED